jgi:small-conductance mechanosensitive channel
MWLGAVSHPRRRAALASNLLQPCRGDRHMTNFIVYIVGTLFVVAGLAYAASRMGVSSVWILAGALVIVGFGLMGGIVRTRQKDPAP